MTRVLQHRPVTSSPLAALDPRWKLASFLLAIFCVALLRMPGNAALALAGSGLLVLLARLPIAWYATRLLEIGLLLLFFVVLLPFTMHDAAASLWSFGPFSVSWSGLELAGLLLFKGLAILSLSLVLLSTTPLNDLLKAAHALHMPGLLVQVTLLAYRYVFLLGAELQRLRIALRVRGFRNRVNRHSYQTMGRVAGSLLVRGHERAERVALAMRCRGFDGQFRSLSTFSTTAGDIFFFTLLCGAALVLLVRDLLVR
jgi:cobalt/nickel transport system permease protein